MYKIEAMAANLTAKGKAETQILRENINDQLNRLFTQLEDLEELKEEFSAAEYEETKTETLNQLHDFQAFLAAALKGDLTLVTEFGAASLAIQAAISQAFKTPEVIRLFAQRQPDQLRVRLEGLKRDYQVKKISKDHYIRNSVEILAALKKMGIALSEEEEIALKQYGGDLALGQLEDVGTAENIVNENNQQTLMSQAKAQINQAAK